MPLAPGTRLGPYEILAPLGAGGMGEVYKARDTRLDRTVAVKILPGHLSASPEARQRFEREARAVSSLSHAHICTLHDIGTQDGVDYLVMEHLEGETLAARLQKGPLPSEEGLRLGIQIADALDRAHRSGIVHRDLKPGNIMLTKSGIKLLDFGLAKSMGASAAPSHLTASPTMVSPLTAEGMIVGTFQYMAPEQLEGKEADARSDIFALGAVLYEAATGKKAFEGKTQASLIGAILHTEPQPISKLQPMAPSSLERLVQRCLAKDPDRRWQSAADIAIVLEWIAQAAPEAAAPPPAEARTGRRELAGWALAALLAVSTLALGVGYLATPRGVASNLLVRAFITPPEGAEFATGWAGVPMVSLSPDGDRLVFEAGKRLWIRPIDEVAARPIPGTEDGEFPFWSPDGRSIGFFAAGKLKTIAASGGPATAVCDVAEGRGGTWSREGVIVFSPGLRTGLYRVPASGGQPVQVTQVEQPAHSTHRWPCFLPDGRHLLYLAANHANPKSAKTGIHVASLDGKESRFLARSDAGPVYASGYLLYMRDGSLLAQALDTEGSGLSGEPVRLVDGLSYQGGSWRGAYAASETDLLVFHAGGSHYGSQLAWFDRSGKLVESLDETTLHWDAQLSPDGQRAAVAKGDPEPSLWIYEPGRGAKTRFTLGESFSRAPIWSPDGSRIAFASIRESGRLGIYEKPSNGSGGEHLMEESDADEVPTGWSPDGRFIVYSRGAPGATQIWVLPLEGDRKAFPIVQTPPWADAGQFSPDGRWIVYTSRESGIDEVYATPFPGPGGKWQVSTAGGSSPRWRRDGKELFFVSRDDILMAASVGAKGYELGVSAPRPLFRIKTEDSAFLSARGYDVSADGLRFLVSSAGEATATPPPLTVTLRWSALLKGRKP